MRLVGSQFQRNLASGVVASGGQVLVNLVSYPV